MESQCRNSGNLGGNAQNMGNQVGIAGNESGNLCIVIEMTMKY